MATSSDEIRKVAQQVWGALDKLVDTNPEEYQKFINEQLKEGKEMFAPPEPAFCLQCNVSTKVSTTVNMRLCYLFKFIV